MMEMSCAYAHESNVGPVVDVTNWSPVRSTSMGLLGLVSATCVLAVSAFLWHPSILEGKMPQGAEHVVGEAIEAQTTHAWKMRAAMAITAGLGGLVLVASVARLRDGVSGRYYFRAGSGGLSLRLPHGLSWAHGGLASSVLELDLPWDEIADLTIVQTKQLGSMSRNAGNIGADLRLATCSGKKYEISLDGLSAAAYLIHERLQEAHYMPSEAIGT